MGAFFETISPSLVEWLQKQKMFVVATAPLHSQGHVNVSPKGGDVFGMVGLKQFWYMEMSGSGSETVSHLYEPGNGRITIMFMAFDGPPRILRLWGRGSCLENGTQEYSDFVREHDVATRPGTRSIILVDIHQVGTSCGFSVPYYDFKAHREILNDFYRKKSEKFEAGDSNESIERYWALKNAWSIDGLPSYKIAQKTAKLEKVAPIKKMVGRYATPCYTSGPQPQFTLPQLLLAVLAAFLAGMLTVQTASQFDLHSTTVASLVRSFK